MDIQMESVVGGFEIVTIIDATGRVIRSTSRPMTMRELAPLFAAASERDLDLKRGSEVDAPSRLYDSESGERDRDCYTRFNPPSESKVEKIGTTDGEERDLLEYAYSLGVETRRMKEMMVEFPPRRVGRALDFLKKLLDDDQEVKSPTGLVVSQILAFSKKAKNKG